MAKKLLLAGGGHAHMMVLANLRRFREMGHEVTVIQPSPYHYYSGMGPGMFSGMYRPQQARFHIRHMVENRGGTFLEDKVAKILPEKRALILASGGDVSYDVVSFNTGSEVPMENFGKYSHQIIPVKPIFN